MGVVWQIKEELDLLVDAVIDGDDTGCDPSTVIDFSAGYPEVVRVGSGDPTPFRMSIIRTCMLAWFRTNRGHARGRHGLTDAGDLLDLDVNVTKLQVLSGTV